MRQRHHAVELDAAGPRAHHHHAAAHEHRFVDVVGDEEHGLLFGFPDALQQLLHQFARLVVQRAEGFVHQQHARAVGQRTRQRRALLHAARELLGKVVGKALEPDLGQEAVRDVELLLARHAAFAQTEAHVVQHREPGEQRVALEHHAAVGARAADALAVEQHLAGGLMVQPRHDAQQRALAAAAGAEDGDEVVLGDVEVGGLQRQRGVEAALDAAHLEDVLGHGHRPSCAQGKARRFSHLKNRSLASPMRPMTMMPKMIWSVASSDWLSVIMWPMPLDAPMSSATMT